MDGNGRLALKVKIKVQEQSDGSWLATGTAPPFIVATRDADEIDALVEAAVDDVVRTLCRQQPEQGVEDVLRDLGVSYEWEPATEERTRLVHVPALATV